MKMGGKGEYSDLSEAAMNYIDERRQQNFYPQASDLPYDASAPQTKREEMGSMSLDQSKDRDPTTMAPPQNQVTPSRMQLEPNANDVDQLQDQMNQMDLTPPPEVHMDNDLPDDIMGVAEEHQIPQQFDLQDTKRKLKEIFIFYASFGDRLNTTHLKSHKFHKML